MPISATPGAPARAAALRLLDAVLRQGLPLEGALARATRGLDRAEDRALAHAIAAEALRRLPDLDLLIDGATQRPLPSDAKARSALRIALVQALVLGTPAHAAIATVLPLVDGGPRKLVHGVFGALLRQGATLPPVPTLPAAVAERWTMAWGAAAVAAAARSIAQPPPLDLTLADAAATTHWVEALDASSLLPGHVRRRSAPIPELPGFGAGAWWVQDLAASLPARLLGRGSGTAIDLCAAPGGKTLQLAAAGWKVVAVDQSESRLARLSANLARTRLTAEIVVADVLQWRPQAPAAAVLLDAPCSATGIFRRHPDVLHRAGPRIVAEMAVLQGAMLSRAAECVAPGGALSYSTCSLEPEEGETRIATFLADHADFTLEPPRADELPAGISPNRAGWLRVLPGAMEQDGGCDGFFIARMRRRG